jgi:hypothetical protein
MQGGVQLSALNALLTFAPDSALLEQMKGPSEFVERMVISAEENHSYNAEVLRLSGAVLAYLPKMLPDP